METKQATPSTTVVYSKPNCPSCVKAKMLLDNKKIPYTESVIGKDIQVETLIKEFELNNWSKDAQDTDDNSQFKSSWDDDDGADDQFTQQLRSELA